MRAQNAALTAAHATADAERLRLLDLLVSFFFFSLLLSSLELSDIKIYEP